MACSPACFGITGGACHPASTINTELRLSCTRFTSRFSTPARQRRQEFCPSWRSEAASAVLTSGDSAIGVGNFQGFRLSHCAVDYTRQTYWLPSPSRIIAWASSIKTYLELADKLIKDCSRQSPHHWHRWRPDTRIIGGGVAVDGDAIKGFIGNQSQGAVQQFAINLCISGHKAEHGGHIGLDHA